VGQRRRPQPTFSVNVKPWWHWDILIWVPFSWTLRMSEVSVCGPSGTLLQGQGSYDLKFSVRATDVLSKAYMYQDRKGSNPLSFLLYSILPRYNHSHYRFLSYKIIYLVNVYLTESYSTENSQQHSLHKAHEILYNWCDSRSFCLCIMCNLPKQCRVGHWRRVACTYITPDCKTLLKK
jgi:hypothetical protein